MARREFIEFIDAGGKSPLRAACQWAPSCRRAFSADSSARPQFKAWQLHRLDGRRSVIVEGGLELANLINVICHDAVAISGKPFWFRLKTLSYAPALHDAALSVFSSCQLVTE